MAMDIPAFHACLNATSAICLSAGFYCIKTRRLGAHMKFMIAAATASSIFLISYVLYHARVGTVHFQGSGWVRTFYLSLLLFHTILAIAIVPLATRTLWLAARQRFVTHKAIARWTLPLWLVVCVTGLIVYWMLYQMAEACPGCKEAFFDPQQLPQRIASAKGYALSILMLLAVPTALIGGIVWAIVANSRQPRPPTSQPDSIDTQDVSR